MLRLPAFKFQFYLIQVLLFASWAAVCLSVCSRLGEQGNLQYPDVSYLREQTGEALDLRRSEDVDDPITPQCFTGYR